MHARVAEQDHQIERLMTALHTNQQESESTTRELREMYESQLQQLQAELKHANDENTSLHSELEKLRVAQLQERETARREIASLEAAEADLKRGMERLLLELEVARAATTELEATHKNERTTVATVAMDLEKKLKEIRDLRENIILSDKKHAEAAREARNTIEAQSKALEEQRKELELLRNTNMRASMVWNNEKEKLEKVQAASEEQRRAWEKQIQDVQTELAARANSYKAMADQYTVEKSKLQQTINDKGIELEKVTQYLENSRLEKKALETALQRVTQQQKLDGESAIQQREAWEHKWEQEQRHLEMELQKTRENLEIANKQKAELEKLTQQYQEKDQKKDAEKIELANELMRLLEQKGTLEEKLQQMERSIGSIKNGHDNFASEQVNFLRPLASLYTYFAI